MIPLLLLFLWQPSSTRARPGGRAPFTTTTYTTTYPPCTLALFPLPSHVECGAASAMSILSPTFSIRFSNTSKSSISETLQLALNRTLDHLFTLPHVVKRGTQAEPGITPHTTPRADAPTTVTALILTVDEEDVGADKQLSTDESYTLSVARVPATNTVVASLRATNIYGAIYGLSTFTNLFLLDPTLNSSPVVMGLPITIADQPRFSWRGVLLDTANHYFPMSDIYRTLGAMFSNKFNVLHLHLVDSYSFPYASAIRPKLAQGAWTSTDIYTVKDIEALKAYAMVHYGIILVVEMDMPGHAYSWGIGYPETVADCPGYGDALDIGHINAVPFDPSKKTTYDIVTDVLNEVIGIMGELCGGCEMLNGVKWC
jgi:hypothetical protein